MKLRDASRWAALQPRLDELLTLPRADRAARLDVLAAQEPEEALALFFDFAQQYFTYSALFVVHGDLAEGRDAFGPGAPRARVAGVGVTLDLPSCLSQARARGGPVCLSLAKAALGDDEQAVADLE